MSDVEVFEAERASLLAHAYRMLGEWARAQDVVQDAWLRFSSRTVEVARPGAYLLRTVTNLCLNELGSARARREEARGDRLPEPVDVDHGPLASLESLDAISMAFLVVLQRLRPAERAALLLHDVFGCTHAEVAAHLGKSELASRKLLSRAKRELAEARRALPATPEVHARLVKEFVVAARTGDLEALVGLLVEDVELTVDAGQEGATFGGARNLPGPLRGRARVAAFVASVGPRGAAGLDVAQCQLNGTPAVVVSRDGSPFAAIVVGARGTRIHSVWIQADPAKLATLRTSS